MPKIDKRVFEIRASIRGETAGQACTVEISADATLLDLHLCLLAVFDWPGSFAQQTRAYHVTVGGKAFTNGRGSRTALRRLLSVGETVTCSAKNPAIAIACDVAATHEVKTRRFHPKVLEIAGDEWDQKTATWRAQEAVRRGFRQDSDRRGLSAAFVHGYFSALISGPMIMPNQWLGDIADEIGLDVGGPSGVQHVLESYDTVARGIQQTPERYVAETQLMLGGDDAMALVDWSRGFMRAMALAGDEWLDATKNPEIKRLVEPIAAAVDIGSSAEKRTWLTDEEFRRKLARVLGISAVELARLWRERLFAPTQPIRRSEKKISPNAPCPCGSGVKYKRCCSPLRAV